MEDLYASGLLLYFPTFITEKEKIMGISLVLFHVGNVSWKQISI